MNTMFSLADRLENGGAMVVSENNVNRSLVKEMNSFIDVNNNQQWDEGTDIETYRFKVFVFLSKDDSYLRKAFDITEPAPDELCLYLEDNTDDIFSGASSYVKIGSGLVTEAKRLEGIASSAALEKMADALQLEKIGFTREDLAELIKNGGIANTSRDTVIGIMQALNLFNIALAPAVMLIGNGILAITAEIRPYITFQNHHWDPAAEQPAREGAEETSSFEPFFFPGSNSLIEVISNEEEQAVSSVTGAFQQSLSAHRAMVTGHLQALLNADLSSNVESMGISSSFFKDFLTKAYDFLNNTPDLLSDLAVQTIEVFEYMGVNMLNAINAFYCGLWNALVNTVLGLIDTVGYIFQFMGAAGEFWSNAQELIPQLYELVDEAVQSFFKLDVRKIISAVLNQLSQIDIAALASSISVERLAYFAGAFIGFVVELLIGFLFTGGVSSGSAFLTKIGTMGTNFIKITEAAIAKIFIRGISQVSGKSILTMLIHYARKMIEILKKGTEEMVRLIQSFFDELNNLVKLSKETIKEIILKFKITMAEKQLLEKLGIEFVNFEEGIATACKLVNR